MSHRPEKEKYQSIPTTTYVKTVQYAPTVVLPTQVITEYSNVKPYEYKTSENYNITGTKTITTTTTTNNTNYYPHTIYYSNPQYGTSTNDNYSKYAYNTYIQSQPNQNNQGRKTVQYVYQQINDKKQPQIIKYEFDQNPNNIIYNERKTNLPQTNNLNLNNIYNLNKDNKGNTINQNVNYEYFNNNMYIKESGNTVNQKPNTQKNNQKNIIPNNNYYNAYTNSQQQTTTKQLNKNNNINKTNVNYYNNINVNTKTNSNANINNKNNQNIDNLNNQQHKANIKNQNNLYNNKKMTHNNVTNTNNSLINNNYSGNPQQQIIKNTNNKALNNIIYEGIIVQEPPDNKRKKKKNDNESFSKTMPNLTVNNDIKTGIENNQKTITVERNSYPIQAISNFEISFHNNTTNQNKFNNTQPTTNKNNIPLITNNINTNNIQNIQTQNKNNNRNIEYKDQFGNIYILINGQYINKATLNQNKNININKNTNTNIKIEKNSAIYKNKDNVYYEHDKVNNTKEQKEIVNTPVFYDKFADQMMNNEKQANINNNSHLNKIKQEMILQNNNQYNDYLNNTYPIEGQKVYQVGNLIHNNNQNINDRNNRFIDPLNQDININSNNYNIIYNADMNNQQQQLINNDIVYKKTKSGAIGDNDIQTVEPKKRRPVYKIPPSKKRAVSQGRSLIFIHKYYDENFILEEDNEDNASDSENKKNKKNKLKNFFRQVTNIKRLIPHEKKEIDTKNSPNTDINDINNNNLKIDEELNKLNLEKQNKDNNIENSDNVMRLSHMRFSLERTYADENKDNNQENIDNIQDNNKIQNGKIDDNQFKIENNTENEEEKIYCSIELNPQIPIPDTVTQSNLSNYDEVVDSNLSGPRNSDSVIGSKKPLENKTIKIENKNSDDLKKTPKNIDIKSPTYTESLIKDSKNISNKEGNLINSNRTIDEKKKININVNKNTENEKKTDDDERISLNIPEYDLDKYFEKEGINKRSADQGEISTSLKTINLEENRNSQIIVDNLEEDQKKSLKSSSHSLKNSSQSDKLERSSNSNNISLGNSKDGSKLLMLEDAITGSVHIQENIQDFVKKNNKLYSGK